MTQKKSQTNLETFLTKNARYLCLSTRMVESLWNQDSYRFYQLCIRAKIWILLSKSPLKKLTVLKRRHGCLRSTKEKKRLQEKLLKNHEAQLAKKTYKILHIKISERSALQSRLFVTGRGFWESLLGNVALLWAIKTTDLELTQEVEC